VPSARVGLPEVNIGILPGGGGTQALPRIVGVEKALEMMTTGRHVPAKEALASGIIDEIVPEGNLKQAAIAYAKKLIADNKPVKPVGIIGAGTMGGGIAMNFANVGIPVKIVETKQEALDRGLSVIRKNYERTAQRGGITQDDVEKRMKLISGSLDLNQLKDVD